MAIAAIVILLFLIIVLLMPFNFMISPPRVFKVVDARGVPIEDALVKQIWDQYSLDYSMESEHRTDSEGVVFLPRRVVKTRLIDLLRGGIMNIIEYKIHAAIGSYDSVAVSVPGHKWKWFYNGEGLESGIVKIE